MKKVTILICTPDVQSEITRRCLDSLVKHTDTGLYKLVVVDNKRDPGFSHPQEINKCLMTLDTGFLACLDDDVVLTPGWLEALLAAAERDPSAGAVGCMHLSADDSINHSGGWIHREGRGQHFRHLLSSTEYVPYVCSACVLIRKTPMLFDETFRKYWHESEFCLRLWETGFRVAVVPHKVYHLANQQMIQQHGKEALTAARERDRAVFVKKWVETGRIDRLYNSVAGKMTVTAPVSQSSQRLQVGKTDGEWSAILARGVDDWRKQGSLSALAGLPAEMPWSAVLQTDGMRKHLCDAPGVYADCLAALSAVRPADTAMTAALDLLADMMTRKSDSSYAGGCIADASDCFSAALKLKYASHLRDRSFRYLERVNFEITSVCNLRCKYCNFESGRRKKYIDPEFYRRVHVELAQDVPGLKRLALYMSGESLLHPEFIRILEITRQVKDAHPQFRPLTYLHTNGMLWKPEMNDRILATGALDQVTWSIDGVDAKSFEDMRRGARFATVMNNFEHFLATRPASVTATVNNIVERGSDPCAKCPEMTAAFARADSVNTLEPKELNSKAAAETPTKWDGRHDGFCEYIFHTAVVTTDGRMSLCCVDYNSVNAFGDIARDGFKKTYYGEERNKLLRLMADSQRAGIKGCRACTLLRNAWSTDLHRVGKTGPANARDDNSIRARWKSLKTAEGVRRVALFGAGKHTKRLNELLGGVDGPEVAAVVDDNVAGKPAYFGKAVRPAAEFDPRSVDAIVLSTDCLFQPMHARCTELYGSLARIMDLYHEWSFE